MIRDGMTLIASSANSWPHYVPNMKAGDILVAFDIRRYEHDILRLVEMAKTKDRMKTLEALFDQTKLFRKFT